MTSRWVRTYRFSDDKRWLVLSSTALFVCPFFELLEMKKNVSLLPEKNNNFFLYLFNAFFLFCFQSKKNKRNNTFFICFFFFFFYFPSDDNWWQGGRWYGNTNLVMTWWLGWVVVTKWSKCWWLHIEMVPYNLLYKTKFFYCLKFFFVGKSGEKILLLNSVKNFGKNQRVRRKVTLWSVIMSKICLKNFYTTFRQFFEEYISQKFLKKFYSQFF